MSLQNLFDRVSLHLLTQGHKAMRVAYNSAGREVHECSYRSSDGSQCAVGCIIPDHLYRPEYESHQIFCLKDLIKNMGWTNQEVSMLQELQYVHDSSMVADKDSNFKMDVLKRQLDHVAVSFGLDPSILYLNGEKSNIEEAEGVLV